MVKKRWIFISGIFHLIFLDWGWHGVTETADKGGWRLYLSSWPHARLRDTPWEGPSRLLPCWEAWGQIITLCSVCFSAKWGSWNLPSCDFCMELTDKWASLVAQLVKNLPAMQETQVQLLGWEDPLEKEMATHSTILAWKIPWIKESDGLHTVQELQRVGHNWATKQAQSLLWKLSLRLMWILF